MVFSPAFALALILATLYGALTHLLLGGDGRRLAIMIVSGWVGFAIGQAIGQIMEIHVIAVGPLNLFTASLGAVIATLTSGLLAVRRPSH